MKDQFTRKWILEEGIPIINSYSDKMTIRQLYYRLVSIGMTNSIQHYKRVVGAMIKARWDNDVSFDAFVDHDRQVIGQTEYEETILEDQIESGKRNIESWMGFYYKNRWENQPIYLEVFIEKKALQSVFEHPCRDNAVALCPCKGYPSLTYLNEAADRFLEADGNGKELKILYFGDYDPSGEDIPRSMGENLHDMGVNVEIKRIALTEHQVIEMKLPPAPAKLTDSRTANWNGLGQVELDAIEPTKLREMADEAIMEEFDDDLFIDLRIQERQEKGEYKSAMKEFVQNWSEED